MTCPWSPQGQLRGDGMGSEHHIMIAPSTPSPWGRSCPTTPHPSLFQATWTSSLLLECAGLPSQAALPARMPLSSWPGQFPCTFPLAQKLLQEGSLCSE